MGGIRAAGDLVARMQLSKKMRIHEAKEYVADKLHVTPFDLSDPTAMRILREELDIGIITGVPGVAKGLAAKANISKLLDIEINCVEQLRRRPACTTEAVRAAGKAGGRANRGKRGPRLPAGASSHHAVFVSSASG
jgi:hypothetical protein